MTGSAPSGATKRVVIGATAPLNPQVGLVPVVASGTGRGRAGRIDVRTGATEDLDDARAVEESTDPLAPGADGDLLDDGVDPGASALSDPFGRLLALLDVSLPRWRFR